MPTIIGPESKITRGFSEVEKQMGVDLKINKDGDLELTNIGDVALVAGSQNAAQAIRVKLQIEPGSLLYHPNIGTDLTVGNKTRDAFAIKAQIIRSIAQDPRFSSVFATVRVVDNVVFVDMKVTILNTNVGIPLQFAVPG